MPPSSWPSNILTLELITDISSSVFSLLGFFFCFEHLHIKCVGPFLYLSFSMILSLPQSHLHYLIFKNGLYCLRFFLFSFFLAEFPFQAVCRCFRVQPFLNLLRIFKNLLLQVSEAV